MTAPELLTWFVFNYPELVNDMKNSDHKGTKNIVNPFHAEGDVWTHTMMVLKQAENQGIVEMVCALLHDIGKPAVRNLVDIEEPRKTWNYFSYEKVTFYGHEGVSSFMSLDILYKMVYQKIITETELKDIFRTISLHGLLWDYMSKESEYVNKFFNLSAYSLSVKQSKNDSLGRFNLKKDLILAEDLGVEFFNEKTFLLNHKPNFSTSDYVLEILIGLPGSGKSTYCSTLTDSYIVSRDYYIENFAEGSYSENWASMSEDDQKEVDKMLDNRYRNGIRAKERHIVIDMTNLSPKSRRKWVSTARGYKVIMTVFLTSIEESYEFNQARVGKKLPKSLLMNMASRFIHPTMDECHEVRYV